MNKLKLLTQLLFFLSCMPQVFAGISYEKAAPKTDLDKTAQGMQKVMLSGVDARLRVEGASFKLFNLYLAPIQIGGRTNPVQRKLVADMQNIIERDFKIVKGFSFVAHSAALSQANEALLKQKGAEGTSKLDVSFSGDTITAILNQKNLVTGKSARKSFSASATGLRKLSHLIAQSIYEEFIGPENIFSLQIAAIKRGAGGNQVVLLDFDGRNETVLSFGPLNKTSPYFAPDAKTILYTIISARDQAIVEQDLVTKKIEYKIKKPGINIDPRIFPDNSAMLATLSFESDANIYRATRSGTILGKMTVSTGMNLSPSIHPNGKEFAFVSDRAGSAQIYVQSLTQPDKAPERLTFLGTNNTTPNYNYDGTLVSFTGRDEKKMFDIFICERESRRTTRVTENQGRNQEPNFTPSGRFLIFTSEREGKSKPDVFLSSLNGDHQFRLTDANSDAKNFGYFSPTVKPK